MGVEVEHLPSDIKPFVENLLESGRYESFSLLVLDALYLLKDRETLHRVKLEELRAAIQVGIDQLDRGEVAEPEDVTAEAIHARGMARLAAAKRRASA